MAVKITRQIRPACGIPAGALAVPAPVDEFRLGGKLAPVEEFRLGGKLAPVEEFRLGEPFAAYRPR